MSGTVDALSAALRDPETVELMVNDDGTVYRERTGGGLERLPCRADARRVLKVSEITGMELDNVSMADLFELEPRSRALRPTGMIPKFYEPLRDAGYEPPLAFFQP